MLLIIFLILFLQKTVYKKRRQSTIAGDRKISEYNGNSLTNNPNNNHHPNHNTTYSPNYNASKSLNNHSYNP